MKHKVYILLVFIFIAASAKAQFKYQNKLKTGNKGFSITTGAEVISFGGNTFFGTYIMPRYSFSLTPKFNITTGFNLGNLNSSVNFSETNTNMYYHIIAPLFSNFVFVEGEYSYSDHLKIRTSFYSTLQQSNTFLPGTSINPLVNNWKSAKIGFDYKISDGFFINAEFGVTNSPLNLYRDNPFRNYRFY